MLNVIRIARRLEPTLNDKVLNEADLFLENARMTYEIRL